jgi:copper chaperone CopZ
MTQVVLTVPDISCSHCEATVTKALAPLPGVRHVRVDIPAKRVTVQYDEGQVDVERFKAVLQEEDYPVASATEARG